ncbi:Carotenoid cleavage dioxygenase 7 [Arachis hypogaea]|nr:Carotenoid cleavage dioxygenase 7 [Arachis hypogaea]
MKNVANTSVVRWGEKLLCMWEGGEPYEIDSWTLDTIGWYNMMDGHDDSMEDSDGVWEIVAGGLLKPILYGMCPFLLLHYIIAG